MSFLIKQLNNDWALVHKTFMTDGTVLDGIAYGLN